MSGETGRVRFRVLGSVGADRDGAPLDLGGRRQRSVVARLLVAGGRMVPAELLVADLWQGASPADATGALQAHVSHLRRVLEPGRAPRTPARLLVTVPPGYAIRAEGDATDVGEATRLLDEGDRLLEADPAAARQRYTAAIDLWRGPAYAEYADEPWAAPEAARLDELRLTAVERRAAAALAAPGGRDALPQLRAHVAEHPMREEGWRLLALGLYRAGRQGEALAALRDVRARLADELGVDPGPALRALEDDVLAQAPHLLPVRAPAPAAGRPVPVAAAGPPRPVGRDAELAALEAAADRAAGGRLEVALLAGEAGSGKTTVLDSLRAILAARGWTTLAVSCPETDGAPPGWPWAEALRALAATCPSEDPAPLAALLTDDAPAPAGGDPAGDRFRLHRAVAAWLARAAATAPLLVTVDDMHRADRETTALLLDVLPALAGSPVLLVAGHRPEESAALADVLAALARRSPEALRLRGLDRDAVDALVARWSITPVDGRTRAAIAERADGNPFHVRELVRLVGGGAEVAAVPGSVRDVVRHRLAALPARTGTLLRLAAVIGRDVDAEVLLAAAGENDEEALVEALEAALVSGLLVEPGPGRLRFVHALVRDTLYEDLSSLRRTRLHGRVAAVLERLRPDDVTALAHHAAAAGPGSAAAAARWSEAAAELAQRRFAHADAAVMWGRAADATATARPGDGAELARLLAAQAAATALAGAVGPARALRARALAALPDDAPAPLTAAVLLSSDVPTFWNPRVDPVDDRFLARTEALAASLSDDDPLRPRLLALLATELEERLDERAAPVSRAAVEAARRAGDPVARAHALAARAVHTHRDSAPDERAALGTELLDLARGHGLGVFEAVARLVLLQDACARFDLAAADEQAAAAEELAGRHGLRLLRGIARAYGGMRLACAGRGADADRVYGDAVEELLDAGWYRDVAESVRVVGRLCLHASGAGAGVPPVGRADVERVLSAAPDDLRESVALALVLAGDAEGARALGPALPRYGRDPYTQVFLYFRGVVGLALGDPARTAEAEAGLAPWAARVCAAESASVALGPTATLLARLAAARGDVAAAAAHQRVAVAVATASGNPGWLAAARAAV
ncbi:BTAD domain-containing putative transcriptional regulator [Geodermatophilus nigrescens]|uniref:Transcriptional regulatory protein, C terminal n=1 Tax=Geodermatophilus nigrescens TaxID=1070870 RepID=A0A1M5IL88_9ACTN|nr:BTAD domain-containing putative transcriptional regulator [Geodermatophilus nigrescens]SHG29025.1 Transcriptional regulatory protein, C terminal [Geodermatophilus nigrescens]